MAVLLALLAATLVVAWPSLSDWRTLTGCEPRGWVDWHLAMQRSCLTTEYVCRNMTTAKLLEDPTVADELRRALESGNPNAVGALDSLVDGMRAEYGCARGAPTSRWGRSPRLPPGHPPVGPRTPGPRAPSFEAPVGLDI